MHHQCYAFFHWFLLIARRSPALARISRFCRKPVLLSALALALAFSLSGCAPVGGAPAKDPNATPLPPLTEPIYQDAEAFMKSYHEVTFDDTMETLTERYGQPEKQSISGGDFYLWALKDGYGFSAVFFDSGALRAKVINYGDIRQLQAIAPGKNMDSTSGMTKDMTYEVVCSMLGGPGIELMRTATSEGADRQYNYLVFWMDEAGNIAQILFDGENKISRINYDTIQGKS